MRKESSAIGEIPLYNTRAGKMWEFISANADFTDAKVIDAGCGYGDLMWRAYEAGASSVFGYDNDKTVVMLAVQRLETHGYGESPIYVLNADINKWNDKWPGKHEIAFCTSVLPYVDHPTYILESVLRDSRTAFIECQYYGDGPGLQWIKSDEHMAHWLMSCGANNIDPIGRTTIIGRGAERTLWKCT